MRAGTSPFLTDRILHPVGANLWFHTYTPISGALNIVLDDAISTLNVMVFSSFLLSGLGSYILTRKFVDDRRLAALAGLAFSYCPYKLAHLIGHYNLVLTATIPAFAVCVVSFCELSESDFRLNRSPRRFGRAALWALGAVALLLVTVFSDYYYTYFLLWFAALYFAYWRFEGRIQRALPAAKKIGWHRAHGGDVVSDHSQEEAARRDACANSR